MIENDVNRLNWLIFQVRKPSGSVSQTNRPVLALRRTRGPPDGTSLPPTVNENSKGSSISAPYSPMSGVPCGNGFLMNGGSPSSFKMVDLTREPLLTSSQLCRSTTPPPVGSYVPPGYILVDHGSKNKSSSTVTSPERDKEVIWYWLGRRGMSVKKVQNFHEYITVTAE